MKLTRFMLAISCLFIARVALGQEMEPRSYSPAPVGTQYVFVGYAYQSGDVLFDASLPIKDASIRLNAATLGYGRSFNLAGRQGNVSILYPYLWGTAQGTVFEDQLKARRSGGGDLRIKVSALFKGGPALSPKQFIARKPGTVIGASVSIVVPSGQYDPARLVNLGSNRWAFKPEVGISKPVGRWTLEAVGGAWLFTANNSFLGNSRREQKAMASLSGDVIYTIRRRMWVSGNAAFYTGGRTVLNGTVNDDRQRNTRVGATFSWPLNQRQSVKIAWAKGVTTRIGGNLNTVAVAWQYVWF